MRPIIAGVISVLVLVVYTAGLALWVRFMLNRGLALADGPSEPINELLADFEASPGACNAVALGQVLAEISASERVRERYRCRDMSMTWGKDASAGAKPLPVPVTDVLLRRARDREAFEGFMAAWEAEVLERIRSRGGL